ncbi:MAG: hypothetical protein K8R31_09575 [Bacteroidales bacterium]|nr:hypothetical protein [Bacteroidales bacterium]
MNKKTILIIMGIVFAIAFMACEKEQDLNNDEPDSVKRKINIVFDVHTHEDFIIEVVSGSPNPEIRMQVFKAQLNDLEWLLDITRNYGADISFLSVGPWAEMCTESEDKERCLSLVKQLYESGGIIGTHSHEYKSKGQFNEWEKLQLFQMTGSEQKKYLEENVEFVNNMIKEALGLSNPSEISAVNLVYGSPEPRGITNNEKYNWLSGLGFKMKEGGEEQQMLPYFHQVPYNPFRPGEFVLEENTDGKLITIPQYPIFDTGTHFGVEIDASAKHLKAMFLQLYLNWKTNENDLVWVFSVGSHLHDWDPNDVDNRQCLDEMLGWLQEYFVDKGIAEFSNYREVMEEFEEWESTNPGTSSFHYPLTYPDYDYYPYLEWVNRYLKNSLVKNKIQTEQEVNAYLMESGNYQLVLAFTDKTSTLLDLSEYFSSPISRVYLETGESDLIDPSSISLDQRSVIFCNPDDCEAILNSK